MLDFYGVSVVIYRLTIEPINLLILQNIIKYKFKYELHITKFNLINNSLCIFV